MWLTTTTLLLVASATAVPMMRDARYGNRQNYITQCAISCPETSNAKFQYVPGQTYEYMYEGDIKTSVAGSSSEHSSLHMTSTVYIDVVSTCEMNLRLSGVSLQDSNPSNYDNRQPLRDTQKFTEVLQGKTMSFAFIDGRIESVCPQSDDEVWAVNIRRGIVSTIQNSMNKLQGIVSIDETDVTGQCPVKYEVLTSNTQTIRVKKTKDLMACKNRHDAQTIFKGTPYDVDSDVQSMPLMQSKHVCEQEINTQTRLVTMTTCSESHAFRPFAKWNSGATTDITYRMTFRRQYNNNQRQTPIGRIRSSLLFDHTLSADQSAETIRDVATTFQQLCENSMPDIRPDAPKLFTKVVHQMRTLDSQSLRQLGGYMSRMCNKAEKFYRDALPLLGTTASLSTMNDMLRSRQISEQELDVWMSAIAFYKNPSSEMIRELRPVLSTNMPKAALAVSSLINTYCTQQSDQCRGSDQEVAQIMKMFEDELRYNCRSQSDEQTQRMLTALRAVGNAGLAAQSVVSTLTRCAGNDATPMSIRVAAVNAFRRVSCDTNDRSELFQLFENHQADSELRINAYLTVMQCASHHTLHRIQRVLETDEINQVLSFVWTHLTNIQETASPLKQEIRAILENAELKKEYDMDKRKFSRNVELSAFSELLNAGGSVESNLIWSGESFVPRSGSFNFTVDMFGKSVNLFEVGGRIQGAEDILEKLLGPGSHVDNSIRRDKRAPIRDELLNRIDRTFNKQPDPDQLSYYMRLFGDEIHSGDVFSFDLESLKNKFNFFDWLIELAKEHNIDITKSYHFLDATVVIPTGTGMPIKLNAEGSATVGLTARGKIDVRQMWSSPSTFDVNGSVKPSAALQIEASMGVDAMAAMTGLKIVNTLHSSTVLDGLVQLRDGRIFNFDWNMPQNKIEIFNAESHIYVTYRGEDREQTAPADQVFNWRKCTNGELAEKAGLELCAELSVPKRNARSVGPAIGRVYVNKLDTYRGVHFEASYIESESEGSHTVRLSFSTPGSRIDRELTTEFVLKRPQRQAQLRIKTPWKKIDIDGLCIISDRLKKSTLTMMLDDRNEYSITTELQVNENRRGKTYTPKLQIVMPGRQDILLDGLIALSDKRYDVRMALKNAFSEPVTADGWIQVTDKRRSTKYDVSVQIGAPQFKGNLTGYTSRVRDNAMKTWSSRAVVVYTYRGGHREQFIFNHKLRDQSVSNLNTYSSDCSWTSSLWPQYNGQSSIELQYSANSVRTKLEAGLDDVRKVTIITSGAYDFVGTDKKFNGFAQLSVPYKDWNYNLKVDHSNNWDSLHTSAEVRYGGTRSQQAASADVTVRKEGDRPLSIVGEANLRFPGREIRISETLTERAPREYANNAVIQWQRNERIVVESTYKMQPRHELTNTITATGLRTPITINGHLLPNSKNAQGRAEVTYDGKSYLLDGSYSIRGLNSQQFNARMAGEAWYAGRGASISGETTRRDEHITNRVEIRASGNRIYTATTSITASMSAPRIETRLDWPQRNFIELTGTGRYDRRASDMEARVKMTSSLEPIQIVEFGLQHDKNYRGGIKTNADLTWAPNKKIVAELTAARSQATVVMTTPFYGYRSVRGDLSYSRRGMSGMVNTRVQWDNGRQMTVMLQGDINQPDRMILGKMAFTSPYSGFESIAANFRHTVDNSRHTTNADVTYAPGKQISAIINMNHQRSGYYVTNTGDLTLTSPYNGMRSSRVRWQHQNTPDTFRCKHDADVDGRKFAVDIDMNQRRTPYNRQVSGRVAFQVPDGLADWLQNTSAAINYQHETRAVKSVGRVLFNYGRKQFTYEHDVNVEPSSTFVAKAKLTTPYRSVNEIGLALNNRMHGSGWTANNELVMGSLGRIGLDANYQRSGMSIDTGVSLTTPLEGMERLSGNLRNQQQRDGAWVAHADLRYVDKQFSMDGKLGIQSPQKIVELEVRSPYQYMGHARASAGYSGSARNFQASAEVGHNMLRGNITAAVTSNTDNVNNMNVQLTMTTPFRELSSLRLGGRHVRDSRDHTTSTASWEVNRHRGSALADMRARSWADFDGRYEIEYAPGRKMEMTTSLRVDPKIIATASFKSPFDAARLVTAAFNQEGTLDNFRASAEVSHNTVNRYSSSLEATVSRDNIRSSFLLTTPHRQVERVAATFNAAGRPSQFNIDSAVQVNDKRMAKTLNFQLDLNRPRMAITGTLVTPYESIRRLTYTVNHDGPASEFTNNLSINMNGAEITARSEFRLSGPNAKFELRTPYRPVSQISLTHTTKPGRSFNGWQNAATLVIGGRQYTAGSEMGWRGKQLRASAEVRVPEEYSISLVHDAESTANFNSELTAKIADRQIRATTRLVTGPYHSIDFNAALDTPYPGYERWGATFKNEPQPPSGYRASATLTTPLRAFPRASAELSLSTSDDGMSTSFNAQLPFRAVRQIQSRLNYRGNPEDLTADASVSVDSRTVTGTVTFKNNRRVTEGTLAVQTPFAELSKLNGDFRFSGQAENFVTSGHAEYTSTVLPDIGSPSFRVEHTGSSLRNIRTSGELTVKTGRHSMTLNHNGNDITDFRSNVKVTTPGYVGNNGREESYEATVEHRQNAGTTSVSISGPSSYSLSLSKRGSLADMQISGELLTPIRGVGRIAVNAGSRYDQSRSSVESRAQVETQIPGWERLTAGITHSGNSTRNFQTTGYLETSKPGYQRMSASASNTMLRNNGYRSSASIETTIPGYNKFAVGMELSPRGRDSWAWSGSAETPFRGYERWSANFEHTPNQNGFQTTGQLTSPIRGYQSFGAVINHVGNSPGQFQTTVQLRTPFREAPVVDITVKHRGMSIRDFDSGFVLSYGNNRKIESSAMYRGYHNDYQGRAMLATTMCSYFQDFEVSAAHNRQRPEVKSGSLMVKVNSVKKIDLDYSYTTGGDRNININVRSPQSISTEVNVDPSGRGSAVINWDQRTQVRFDFALKNVVTSSLTDRYLSFRTTVPTYRRTVGFGVGYTKSDERVGSRGELYWDRDSRPDFSYEIEGTATKSPSGEPIGYDGKFKVVSALFNTDSSLSHRALYNGRRYRSEIVLDAREKLTIKSDLNLAAPNADFTHVITIQHPRFSKDVTITTEQTPSSVRTTLDYERQTWTMERAFNVQSSRNGPMYSVVWRLTNPASRFDVQLGIDHSQSMVDGTSSGTMFVKYFMVRENQLKTLGSIGYQLNKPRKQFRLDVSTPIDTMSLSTVNRELDLDNGIVRYDVSMQCTHGMFKTVLDYSRPERSLGLKLYDGPDSYAELFAQALSLTQSSLELSHTNGNDKITDLQLSTSYDDQERLVTGRTFIRPRLSSDIQTSLGQLRGQINAARQRLRTEMSAFQSSIDYDRRIKNHLMQSSVVEPVTKIVDYVRDEFDVKSNQISDAFNEKYRNNEFYIRDIYQALSRHIDNISRRTAFLKRQFSDWSDSVSRRLSDYLDSISRWMEQKKREMNDYWSSVGHQWRQIQPNFDHIRPHLDRFIESAKTKLNELYEKMISGVWYREFMYKIEEFKASKYYIPPSEWQQRLEVVADKIDDWLSDVLNKHEVHYVRNWLVAAIQDNNWLYKFLGLEQQVNELIEELRTMTWDKIKTKLRQFANDYFQLEKTRWTVWDPRRGEYVFQIYIPFDLPDADMLKRFDPRPVLSQTRKWIRRQLPDENTTLIDIAYMYKPPSDPRDWIPPFKSHASLFGAQHYMTFDRRFFEFAGDCSYLLARDFIDGTFSVIVNYDRPSSRLPTKKSMTVIAGGQQIEIFPDAKVTVDGSRVEMPVRVGNSTVQRHGNMISVRDDWRGVDVTCDLAHDHCTLAVSGWYFGKTAGLFGTYDNEPSNDWMNADRSTSTRPELTADSWSVGQRCRPVNRAVDVRPDVDSRRYRACAELFDNGKSHFRSCFKHANSSAFMTMCLNDMPIGDNSLEAETDVCKTAAAYVTECRRREIHIRMPKNCIRCEVDTETPTVFHELESVTLDSDDNIPDAADVVFVVQHAPCNRDIVRRVAGLAINIDKAMDAEGINDVRYAVVGFGGKQKHLTPAHVQTMDGQIFNSANKLSWALNNFDSEPSDDADAMAALSYAARLPFAAGASKTVILIGCDSCRENKIRYSDIQRILLNNDIHLHVLVQDIIRLKSKSPKTAYIYGVDQATVYTRKDVSGDDLTGEPDLRRYIRLPKDLCVALSMDTDGSVFSARQWLYSRPPIQKQFIDVLVRTVARKAQPTDCQICECLADESYSGVSQCRSCHRPDPFYWMTPNFDDDDENSDDSSPPTSVDISNNRPPVVSVTGRPPIRVPRPPARRPPIRRRPRPYRRQNRRLSVARTNRMRRRH